MRHFTGTCARSVDVQQAAGRHDDGRLVRDQWQGRDIQFMRSNEHRHVRSGIWNKEGLEGVALEIVSGEEKAGRCDF